MSIRIINQVFQLRAPTGGARLVLLALADNANDDGVCWPSLTTIAMKAGMDERSARRILRRLEKEGYLKTSQRQSPGRKNYTNIYQIILIDASNSFLQNQGNDTVDPLQDVPHNTSIEADEVHHETRSTHPLYDTSMTYGGHCVPTLGTVLPPTGGHGTPTLGTVLPPEPSLNHPLNQQNNLPSADTAMVQTEKFSRITKIYEREIGPFTGFIGQEIEDAVNDYPYEWFEAAFREAAKHNKRSWAYVKAILVRYKVSGFASSKPKEKPTRTTPLKPALHEQADAVKRQVIG